MPAISRSKHQRFCIQLENIKIMPIIPDHQLEKLQRDMESVYLNYEQKMEELKRIIDEYKQKQYAIQNEIKRIRRYGFVSRKMKELDLLKNSFS